MLTNSKNINTITAALIYFTVITSYYKVTFRRESNINYSIRLTGYVANGSSVNTKT
jgi:hypothetical protein